LQLSQLAVAGRAAGIQDNIETDRQKKTGSPDNFAHPSLDPISIVSGAELPWRCHSEAAVLQTICHRKDNKGARSLFRAPLVDRLKFCRVS